MARRTRKESRAIGAAEHPARVHFSCRKTWLGVAGAVFLLSLAPLGQTAGLGELRRQSALGEPLDVVINLSDDKAAGLDQANVRIANSETYDTLGIQRNAALEAAHLSIERKNGVTQLRISSPAVVMEPILSLVVELDYGGGVIRRNYDLLMDPPPAGAYDRYAGAAGQDRDQAPDQAGEPATRLADEQSPALAVDQGSRHAAPRHAAVRTAALAAHPHARAAAAGTEEYGPVRWGSTLSNIAESVRAEHNVPLVKVEQALYDANPQAFSGGPSRLLAGVRLRIPPGEWFRHETATAEPAVAPAAVAAAVAVPDASGSAVLAIAPDAAAAPAAVSHLFRLAEQLDLSEIALASPVVAARPLSEVVPSPAAVTAVAATTTASMRVGDASSAPTAGRSLWRVLFWLPLWGGLAILSLGWAWMRTRVTAKTRIEGRQQILTGRMSYSRAPERLAAPPYPALALNAPVRQSSGLSAPVSASRKLHAAERSEAGVSADLQAESAPRAAPVTAPAAARGRPGEEEPEDTDRSYYAEAEDFLVSALALHPGRADLRLKLLEIYCAAGNLEGFTEQAREYMVHNNGEQSPHWSEVRRMGLDLDPNWSLLRAVRPDLAAPAPSGVRRFYDGLDQSGLNEALKQLEEAYGKVRNDPAFITAMAELCGSEADLPTPYLYAESLSKLIGGAQIYIKRDDLRPINSELLVNALGQVMLAKWIGRSGVTAGLEDGGHAEAVAKAAKAMNIPAIIFVPQALMDEKKYPVVHTLGPLDAILLPARDEDGVAVPDGRRSAMKRWLETPGELLFISSLRSSPMPYPSLVRHFQSLVGQEIRRQAFRYAGGLPRAIVSNIAAGYTTFGLIQSFLDAGDVRIDCVKTHDETIPLATPDAEAPSYTRELDWLRTCKRVNFPTISRDAVAATVELCRQSGVSVPEQKNAGALAQAIAIAKELPPSASVVALFA